MPRFFFLFNSLPMPTKPIAANCDFLHRQTPRRPSLAPARPCYWAGCPSTVTSFEVPFLNSCDSLALRPIASSLPCAQEANLATCTSPTSMHTSTQRMKPSFLARLGSIYSLSQEITEIPTNSSKIYVLVSDHYVSLTI